MPNSSTSEFTQVSNHLFVHMNNVANASRRKGLKNDMHQTIQGNNIATISVNTEKNEVSTLN